MNDSFFNKPLPAVGLAVGAGIVAHKTNANAAKAIGIPVLLFAGLLSLLLTAFGFGG